MAYSLNFYNRLFIYKDDSAGAPLPPSVPRAQLPPRSTLLLLPSIYHVVSKVDGSFCIEQLSNTRDLMEGGCENKGLLPASELALLIDFPNLDYTRLKLIYLREYLTERDI